MINKNDCRSSIVRLISKARSIAVDRNDYKFIPWAHSAIECNLDPSNLSKIVTGVTDPRASTLLAIIWSLDCDLVVVPRH